MSRKGDLSITVIIVAALALVVFVVLVAMFTGKTKEFSSGLNSCLAKQGNCNSKTCAEGSVLIPNAKCDNGNSCCINILNT